MRHTLFLLGFAVLMSVLAPLQPARAFYDVELVRNGSFESGNTGDWTGSTELIGAWSPIEWRTGTQGARFQGDCGFPLCNTPVALRQALDLPVSVNHLTLSAWYRHWSTIPFQVRALNADNPGEVLTSLTLSTADITSEWRQLTLDLTDLSGRSVILEFSTVIFWPPFYSYIDDVSVIADLQDLTAPTSTAEVLPAVPAGENGWHTVPPVVALAATDDAGGSGVQTVFARWDTQADFTAYVGPLTAPEGARTLSYYAQDASGNSEATKTLSTSVDSVSPTATLSYSTAATTTDAVVATLVPSEPVTVTNNGGLLTRTFTANGSFIFTFKDAAGNVGGATATVSNIVLPAPATTTTPTPVSTTTPVTTVTETPAAIVPAVQPQPQVLGATTSRPVIKTLRPTKGAYVLNVGRKTVRLKPFGTFSTSGILAKRVEFGDRGSVLLFLNTKANANGSVKLYSSSGKLLSRALPYGVAADSGLNADLVVQDGERVYLVVGWKKDGRRAQVFEVTPTKLRLVRTLTVTAAARGPVSVKFVKVKGDRYGLVTMLSGQRSTIRVWTYRAASRTFLHDRAFPSSRVRVQGGTISLK